MSENKACSVLNGSVRKFEPAVYYFNWQLAMGNEQLAMSNGQLAMSNEQWPMSNGQ